jgi:PAS domain S-box-containing protein
VPWDRPPQGPSGTRTNEAGVSPDVNVVVADSDSEAAMAVAAEHEHLRVDHVASARACLDAVDGAADCIVAAQALPDEDGVELLEAVRGHRPELPFILYARDGDEALASRAIAAGVTDYVPADAVDHGALAERVLAAAEDAFEGADRRFETLVSNLPGIVYRCRNEPGWPMEDVRGDVEAMTGYAADVIESGAVSLGDDVIHPDDRSSVWQAVQDALEADEPFELTYRIRTAAGETKWAWEQGRGVHGVDGSLVALEGVITDVTARREQEQQLAAMDRVLRHNLHNRMNVVLGNAEAVADDAEEPFAGRAETILQSGRRLLAVTEKQRHIVELLAEEPDPRQIDAATVVRTAVGRLRERHPGADLSLSAPTEAPALAIPRIDRAVAELLENAVRHAGTAVPEARVTVEDDERWVRVRVVDRGPPIPDAERAILLGEGREDPLYHGSGMGLWLVNRVVTHSSGAVGYDRTDAGGNAVELRLPPGSTEVDASPLTPPMD